MEHIQLGNEIARESTKPTKIVNQDTIRNFVDGTITEITFYREGFIKVRETRKRKKDRETMLELRFLDPDLTSIQRRPTISLWLSLGFGVLAVAASTLLPMSSLSQYAIFATAINAALAVVTLLFFVVQSKVQHQFRTANGKTVVLTLTGALGCNGQMLAIVNRIRKSIAQVRHKLDVGDEKHLRAEIQAHYKLAETGAITVKACSDGNFLILSKLG